MNEHGERIAHTPGPWHVESGTLISAGDVTLTRTAEAHTEMKDGARFWETRANATLMAAAPDLLAACEEALDAFCCETDDTMDFQRAALTTLRAAIAKARGA